MRAYCYASGLIEFTDGTPPSGAIMFASGPAKKLQDYISGVARHGYKTRQVNGRPQKIPETDCLLVPGVPEAPDQDAALDALQKWQAWAGPAAKKYGITMLGGGL